MNVIVNRAALLDAASLVDQVVPSRTPLPAMLCQRIECLDGKMTVSGNNLVQYVSMDVSLVQIEENGVVLIKSEKLMHLLRSSEDEVIRIDDTQDDQYVHVMTGSAHFKLYGEPPEKFPMAPVDKETKSAFVSVGVLNELLELTESSAGPMVGLSTDGVRLEISENIRAVGTDGKSIAIADGKLDSKSDQISVTIPTAAIKPIRTAPFDTSEPVEIRVGRYAEFCQHGISLITTLKEGTYPKYRDHIPAGAGSKVRIDRAKFSSALKQARLVTTVDSKSARLSFNANGVTIDAYGAGAGEATVRHDCTMDGPEIAIGLNLEIVLQGLGLMASEFIHLLLASPDQMAVFRDDDDFSYGVAPVILKAA